AAILIERLDERRYAITVDGIVRYVGTQEECQQRAAVLTQKKDRPDQDKALAAVGPADALSRESARLRVRGREPPFDRAVVPVGDSSSVVFDRCRLEPPPRRRLRWLGS